MSSHQLSHRKVPKAPPFLQSHDISPSGQVWGIGSCRPLRAQLHPFPHTSAYSQDTVSSACPPQQGERRTLSVGPSTSPHAEAPKPVSDVHLTPSPSAASLSSSAGGWHGGRAGVGRKAGPSPRRAGLPSSCLARWASESVSFEKSSSA